VVTPEGQGVAGATVWFENSRRVRQGRSAPGPPDDRAAVEPGADVRSEAL